MRRIFNCTLFFLLSLTIILVMPKNIVKADACSYKEQAALNKEAKNIKFNYEILEQKLPDGYEYADLGIAEIGIVDSNGNDVTSQFNNYFIGNYIKISITNLPENFYFVIEDEQLINNNNGKSEYHYSDLKEDVIELKLYDLSKYRDIKFIIYANECGENKLLEKHIYTPKYNMYYSEGICSDISDYKYCQEFLYTNVSSEKVYNNILKYKESLVKAKEQSKKSKGISKKIIIGGSITLVLLGLIAGVIIIFVRKARSERV